MLPNGHQLNILGNTIEQRLKYVRKRFPLLTWGTRDKELVEIMKNTQLLPENLIKFVSEITDQIFFCMQIFMSKISLKFPISDI